MPRACTICTHPERDAINTALASQEPHRVVAQRFAASPDAVYRHKVDHLPVSLAKAHAAKEVALADDLLGQVKALRDKAISILGKAEAAGDLRTALLGIREARACVELLLEVEGELHRQPVVNVLIAPEWLELRTVILQSLAPFPDARAALARTLTDGRHAG
jgi:uncharacterized protein (DUF1810 family)